MAWSDAARAAALAARRARTARVALTKAQASEAHLHLEDNYNSFPPSKVRVVSSKGTPYLVGTKRGLTEYHNAIKSDYDPHVGFETRTAGEKRAMQNVAGKIHATLTGTGGHKNSPGANDLHRSAASSAGKGKKK